LETSLNAATALVIPSDFVLDEGVITSAIGPEEAGDLSDIVGKPPADAEPQNEDGLPALPTP
jgi:hypothetical protein